MSLKHELPKIVPHRSFHIKSNILLAEHTLVASKKWQSQMTCVRRSFIRGHCLPLSLEILPAQVQGRYSVGHRASTPHSRTEPLAEKSIFRPMHRWHVDLYMCLYCEILFCHDLSAVTTPDPITESVKMTEQTNPIKPSDNQDAATKETELEFEDLPSFPIDVPVAPLLRVSLYKLLLGDQDEVDRLWKACCDLGFFYLDLRGGYHKSHPSTLPEQEELAGDARRECTANNVYLEGKAKIDGHQLLLDADELFDVGSKVFQLPTEEKVKYDFKDRGSYFGYKGFGEGVIDAKGTKDRNEFYNVSKDDILGLSSQLPAPELLEAHRDLLRSFMKHSHAIVTLLINLLNARLGLPPEQLASLHKLYASSGDQVRWVHAPPQPLDDRRTALGEHTDFGSVTILFNRLGGLQVLPPHTEQWCYVKPLRGHAVVNLGDAMVKFTAGVLRSNIHRVVNPPGEQANSTRMSLVYFARPLDDVLLKPLEGSQLIDDSRKGSAEFEGEDITSKEWILRRALGRRQGGDWQKSGGTEGGRAGN